MIRIRPAQWPQDATALAALDTAFATERICRLVREETTFRLVEEVVTPLTKRYGFAPADPDERQHWEFTALAEEDGRLVGFAAAHNSAWNRRVVVEHLYVAPLARGKGIGTKLLDCLDDHARSVHARCLWLETQNVNYPAIQFYQRIGFTLCGFDTSLYDPADVTQEEVALFFMRPVDEGRTPIGRR